MNILIKHFWENNRQEIVSKSLLNCHCKGLHSVMLFESPGKTIRLYIAEPGNEMDRNFPENFDKNNMTIGFHSHHCNLTLECVKGMFLNWEVRKLNDGFFSLTSFLYSSKITEGKTNFQLVGPQRLETTQYRWLAMGESVSMKAGQLHTVACHSSSMTAWLVYEGIEDPEYVPFTYSNHDLRNVDFSDLYVKPTEEEILDLLKRANLL